MAPTKHSKADALHTYQQSVAVKQLIRRQLSYCGLCRAFAVIVQERAETILMLFLTRICKCEAISAFWSSGTGIYLSRSKQVFSS